MDIRIRLIPAAIVAVLITIKVFKDDFLSGRPFAAVPVTWFWIVLLPMMYFAAWCISTPVAHLVVRLAKWGLLPPAIFLGLVVGGLWLIDNTWNHTLAAWWDLPKAHFLVGLTHALFGGSSA